MLLHVPVLQMLVHVSYIQRGIKMHRELLNLACFSNPNKYSIPSSFNLSTTKCRSIHFPPTVQLVQWPCTNLCFYVIFMVKRTMYGNLTDTQNSTFSYSSLNEYEKHIQLIHSRRRRDPWSFLCKITASMYYVQCLRNSTNWLIFVLITWSFRKPSSQERTVAEVNILRKEQLHN